MISEAERLRFGRVCRELLLADRTREGIGTLKEKRLHTMLKFFVCDDRSCHEIKIYPVTPGEKLPGVRESSYVADVLDDCDIYEIQTGPLYPLRDKIAFYLQQTEYNVTVIHPLAAKKWVSWIDPADGSISGRRPSPKKQAIRDMLPELYCLLPHLNNRRLRVRALLVEVEEFRIKDGRGKNGRRGATRYEKIPTALLDTHDFNVPADYTEFLPASLPSPFTAAEFGKLSGFRGIDIYSVIKVFAAVGLIREDGKKGRAAAYRVL